ncbi:hypothetical protein ACS5PN_23215 [Roseateles sp. NT4]|uniref:hypothetical protein n=1 Tax=Roseateles sp. NT4 TaxID=3453715 RepID=UPI003EE94804
MAAARLHVSLIEVVEFTEDRLPPLSVVEGAAAAGAQLSDSGSISLQFDRLKSFANHSACVLGCTADSHRRVITVRELLRKLLKQREIKAASVSSSHMTAYYDPARMPRDIVVETLSCVTHCLSLILSHKGCTEHETIAEWPLG